MKKLITTCKVIMVTMVLTMMSTNVQAQEVQGWPANYGGVMLQAFYWDSYSKSKWTKLTDQADELCQYFKLIWIPQSGGCKGKSMGYDPYYWFPGEGRYSSSFGNEEELRAMIKAFKDRGTGTIADVVINHKNNTGEGGNWVDFPAEPYKGVSYQLTSKDVCKNDDKGKTKTWADKNNITLSNTDDEGEDWDGMRDLDHTSSNVQKTVKAYVKMLMDDLGYTGFRYDMVKGYAGYYTHMYNKYAGVKYSVGEFWDGSEAIRGWIESTKAGTEQYPTSAAFDFQFKYVVKNAANSSNWSLLNSQNDGNWPLISDKFYSGGYRRWAITFLENHDTEVRPDGKSNGPLTKDTLAANAYLLAMPGTPCVFLKHWMDYKQDIKAMIDVRKAAGIHNQSFYANVPMGQTFTALSGGTAYNNTTLMTVLGNNASTYTNNNYVKVLEGYHYSYHLNKNMNIAWVDKPSGKYDKTFKVRVAAVTNNSSAKLVYTTNGNDPTASSTKVTSGSSITIPLGETTLKVGLLIDGAVSGIVTRQYKVEEPAPFTPYSITVNVCAENVGWNDYVNFHSWGEKRTGTTWPGDKVTTKKTDSGKTWFYKTYQINSEDDYVNFVFNIGTSADANKNQTVDVEDVTKDAWFEISSTKDAAGHYLVNDVTAQHTTGIDAITTQSEQKIDNRWYNINGQVLNGQPTQKGIYINNGKKVVIK